MQLPYANLRIRHWNEGAEMPLILPVHVICNTSDDAIHDNIRINARRPGVWVKLAAAHGGSAVICGSGPSLADTLKEIKQRKFEGATVFALNGAARYLADNGVVADYQVIIDARAETAQLVGPAKAHLFASQVHPSCFKRAPGAQVWHLEIGTLDGLLPEYESDYCLIGGAASVGNTATCLVYAMGYRELHCYGYDSSHRDGKGHAFAQPMNDGDPCAEVTFNGKNYTASLTMKLQAEKFQETARAIEAMGCAVHVHGSGLLPDMWNTPTEELTEAAKYERMWQHAGYRNFSPGADCVPTFIERVRPSGTVVDFGCGTGRASLRMAAVGLKPVLVDFAGNCRDPQALELPFHQLDLGEPIPLRADYGFCADVMEHIPPALVDRVIWNIMTAAETVFFQISTVPDNFGALINQSLHLTVEPHAWWAQAFIALGHRVLWEERGAVASQFVVQRGESL